MNLELNNTMTHRFLVALLLVCGSMLSLRAQTKVQLSVPDVVATADAQIICVPVIADSFPAIVALQFSLAWDTTELTLDNVDFGDNPLSLNDMTTSTVNAGNFGVTFTVNDLSGIPLPPGTELFQLCFRPTMEDGSSAVTWDGYIPGEFVLENTASPFPFELIPGSVSYGSTVATTVLPGDTDANGQVDHRDLINVGFLSGTTGPARTNASANFTPQSVALWPGTLATGVNHANVDADGDGTIAAADVSVIESNYASVTTGTFVPAPDVSVTTGPQLTLTTDEIFSGANPGTVDIDLGDGNDPNAVGYALAFAIEFDPAEIDPASLRVAFDGSFLGDELLTIQQLPDGTTGRLEVALSRQDQINATTPGGRVATLSFTPRPTDEPLVTTLTVVPNDFRRADQTTAPLGGGTLDITVEATISTQEPAWGQQLSVYPNPYTAGPLAIRGELPAIDAVTVYTLGGRRVKAYTGDFRQLDLSDLPAATYVVQVEINGEFVRRRVVKQ